jgi:hypothetical protein
MTSAARLHWVTFAPETVRQVVATVALSVAVAFTTGLALGRGLGFALSAAVLLGGVVLLRTTVHLVSWKTTGHHSRVTRDLAGYDTERGSVRDQ